MSNPPPTGRDPAPAPAMSEGLVLPDYGGACLSSVVPAIIDRHEGAPGWLPEPLHGTRQVVLLVLDGLGWQYLQAAQAAAPTLAEAVGGPITSVAPTTTATALTSLTTGLPPSAHGVVGYRLVVFPDDGDDGATGAHGTSARRREGSGGRHGEVMDVLHWRTPGGDLRRRVPAPAFQPMPPFGGVEVPVVTRAEFMSTGFTAAHLRGARLIGWSVPSTLVVEVKRLVESGEPFVYAYYNGLDMVSHEHGLGEHYEAELRSVDRLVGDLLGVLPPGAALAVTSDHGQVEVGDALRLPGSGLLDMVELLSGEGRFRWLHVRPGSADDALAAALEAHGDEAWVRTREEMVAEGWFGGALTSAVDARLGDVALVARSPVAFLDPADTRETRLVGRHGSLTEAEMYVPLLSWPTG